MASSPDPSQATQLKQDPVRDLNVGPQQGMSGIELAALGFTVLWLVLAGVYFLMGGATGTLGVRLITLVMVAALPVMMVWAAALSIRNTRLVRQENAKLRVAIEAMRSAYMAQNKPKDLAKEPLHPALIQRLDALAAAQIRLEATTAMLGANPRAHDSSHHGAVLPDQTEDDQPGLALGTPAHVLAPPLSNEDFIRALHFPETADDKDGFAALRRALKDRQVSQLVQASQDVLTLLSQEGIYMDDLRPDLPRPEFWRSFAQGERGRAVAALGGIRDRSSLALTAGRMKEDAIFRDAAHHFLRRFDTNFAGFAERASDAELTEFANTRTARAFMLLGRVAGTFD